MFTKIPKISEVLEALKSLFTKPYTTKFPYKPHQPFPSFRGKPQFFEEKCIGCGACFQVCPGGAIKLEDFQDQDGRWFRRLTINYDSCIFCGQCQRNCLTEEGIKLSSQEYDLSTVEDRGALKQVIEKELVVCEFCGKPVGCREHILWVARRIGPRIFSNPSLFYFVFKDKGLSVKVPPSRRKEVLRQDRIKFLCPHCRRESVLIS